MLNEANLANDKKKTKKDKTKKKATFRRGHGHGKRVADGGDDSLPEMPPPLSPCVSGDDADEGHDEGHAEGDVPADDGPRVLPPRVSWQKTDQMVLL